MIVAPTKPVLTVKSLEVRLPTRSGLLPVVQGVDLQVAEGRVSGIAGESGSGKTMAVMAILGLLPPGSVTGGSAVFGGQNLLRCSDDDLTRIRGKDIALVMQDPHAALHPMLSVGNQLSDHMRRHLGISRREARDRSLDLLRQVRIPDPKGSLDAYPHQFSGGMRQRIAIAIALACDPAVLVADEPTTGLDVTVQAGILELLHDLGKRRRLAILLITHDLGVMSAIADDVTIMYAGTVVEAGRTREVLGSPRHPYTAALLDALPHPGRSEKALSPIPGQLGPPHLRPSGCAFHPRCKYSQRRCSEVLPPLVEVQPGWRHACLVDPFARRE